MGKPVKRKHRYEKECPYCHLNVKKFNELWLCTNFCAYCGERIQWDEPQFKDDIEYYIALDFYATTSDELKEILYTRYHDLPTIEIYEVLGKDLNKIPRTVYHKEDWIDLLKRYQHVLDVDNNITQKRKEDTHE